MNAQINRGLIRHSTIGQVQSGPHRCLNTDNTHMKMTAVAGNKDRKHGEDSDAEKNKKRCVLLDQTLLRLLKTTGRRRLVGFKRCWLVGLFLRRNRNEVMQASPDRQLTANVHQFFLCGVLCLCRGNPPA